MDWQKRINKMDARVCSTTRRYPLLIRSINFSMSTETKSHASLVQQSFWGKVEMSAQSI